MGRLGRHHTAGSADRQVCQWQDASDDGAQHAAAGDWCLPALVGLNVMINVVLSLDNTVVLISFVSTLN